MSASLSRVRRRSPATVSSVVCLLTTLAASAAAQQPAPREIVIRNATVLTASHGTIQNGSVLIKDGKIAAVGTDVKASANATVVDATGKWLTPGVIDCHSHIAVSGSVNEGSLSVTSMVRVQDVVDPNDRDIFYDLSGGVTTANILHGSANAIGGQNAVIKLRWGKEADELIFKNAPPGIKFALGENPKRSNFNPGPNAPRRYPQTRMGVEDVIRDAFTRARDYKAEWDRYNADAKGGKKDLVPPRRDLELEPLVEVLEGRRLVHAHCYTADEILMLLRVAKDFGFRIATFQHVLEGYKVAKEIAAAGSGGSTFADSWAYKVEAFDAIPHNATLMYKAGVLTTVNSDDNERARRLNTEAARAVRYGGAPEEEAIRMFTLNAAKQLGIDKWVGSIDVGKDADLVIWSAYPLSSYAIAEKVFIDGQQYFDRQAAIRAAEANAKEKEALRAKLKSAGEPPKPADAPKKPDDKKPTGGER
jgi:imidazolonepropionase-like amidohydrolase